MRKRPWEVVLLTVLYASAPLLNPCFTLVTRGYALTDLPYLFLAFGPWDFAGLAADIVLAWAVWSVSRPGWWIFLGLNAFLLVLNVWQASQVPGANLWLVTGANLLNTGVAAVLFTKHARSPYFSPRLRWWENEDRYRVSEILEVPLTIRQGELVGRGTMLDVSQTGCFAEVPDNLDLGAEVNIEFSCWGLTLASRGRILRRSKPGDRLQGCGIQFLGTDRDHKHRFHVLIEVLKAHKVPLRA